ncbi:MAG: protein TolR [Candidatus Thiodiazotropha taylori]|uniref:Tol-Pal system protein TolR n=2 Tax=Candidatus Thiodiazotropha TaxID=1913444 RepID=A0A1E2URL7_9GAMM|nr:protein TolR [Candidatus Thiodiazotropha endoloripes]MBV2090561.1 protein TolR [Candidatus Thiodiazotropha taylori]MBW9259295.1 protein TolR [Candidatus Thiodiazotropha sp. (ex. Lucinisca nassula)]MCG7871168.1 protein TolR [Candidatus Thiodiazotropha lotti]MCG7898469.1 protein TolR [Candidatus Thiodiazotropha weberae]MCG7963466.1 protein TolR [Candidatus Thiodiazotropha endolucinida]MCG8018010.1 protein TolR [Candidatus Thiodiazotropha sp. 'RUGA']MCG8489819.1 protein TolR [Chromatiales ba
MSRSKNRRRPMSEINVVPYIDVMLVLLVIFMITAPLLTQGVQVELPQADAEPLSSEVDEPLVVTVNQAGDLFIDIGEDKDQPVEEDALVERVRAVLKYKPKTPIMVRGDRGVPYGRVVEAMVLLQAGGAPSVGLVTESPEK